MFAPVVPPKLLLAMKNADMFGKYHLLLAHDIVEQKDLYKEIFKERDRGEVFVILDNSLIELGYPAPTKDIIEAADIVKPDCIVLPDHLTDMKQTLESSYQAIQEWKGNDLPPYLGVVQGKNFGECLHCAEELVKMGCEYLSVPRIITEALGSRKSITESIFRQTKVGIHLLGFSNTRFFDDLITIRCDGVMGIDSAVPIRLGHNGIMMSEMECIKIGPRGDYWETCTELTPLIANNIGMARGWFDKEKRVRNV